MRTRKVVLLIAGSVLALLGFGLTGGGGAWVWAHTTQRDASGYYTTPTGRLATSSYALTSRVDLGVRPGDRGWTIVHPLGTVRIRAAGVDGQSIFVGIADTAAVDRWLDGVDHERVQRVRFHPFRAETTTTLGNRFPGDPTEAGFWERSSTGTGTRDLVWPTEDRDWTLVVMDAGGGRGVVADVSVGARTGALLPIGLGIGGLGVLLLAGGIALVVLGVRREDELAPLVPAAAYPARLDGRLDPDLSRWRWLVKWLLVLPHVVVLAFLWVAVSVLTVVAGIAILFTGRYPRGIFDFNVGVMRWTWRVSFYAISAFGTDRYPPFSLQPDPTYPADFTVEHPEHLSRGLVLVKWWLLAIPHYLVVALFTGGWGLGWTGGWRLTGGGGLIAVLALVAGLLLLVTSKYPPELFDVVMGLNRWCYRVLAYAALMRDEYPPFRLDVGGTDPGTTVPAPPPAPDDVLVGSTT
jgi:hypothetical protein